MRLQRLQIRVVLRLPEVITTPGAVLHERKIRGASVSDGDMPCLGRKGGQVYPAGALHPPRHLLRICC